MSRKRSGNRAERDSWRRSRALAFASALALAVALADSAPLEAARHARGGTSASTGATPAERAYVAAVDTMRALENPPYATYDSLWKSTGLGFDFEEDDGRIEIDVGVGRSFVKQRTFAASYRAADRALQLTSDTGQRLIGRGRLLEPTWAGAYELLRYGLHGETLTAATAQSIAASPENAPSAEAAPDAQATQTAEPLPNIATVSAIAPLFYRVYDAGSKPCSSGGPSGRALHLVARTNVREHPLTDVVLDPATGRFCSLTFVVKDAGLAGITGHYTIEFEPFGTYWLVSRGVIDIDVRVFGIAAKHATLTWTIAGLATPDTLPESSFERDAVPLPSPEATLPPATSPSRRRILPEANTRLRGFSHAAPQTLF